MSYNDSSCIDVIHGMEGVMFRWEKGRQDTGYLKWQFLAMSWPISMDGYFLKIPAGVEVPFHKDHAPKGLVHWRLNLILQQPLEGGELLCEGATLNTPFIQLFRASHCSHALIPIRQGSALYLSLGWLQKDKS